jgi:hypothetical protein
MIEIFLGHLAGDYLFQNNWMALGKSKHNGLGWLTCTATDNTMHLIIMFYGWRLLYGA